MRSARPMQFKVGAIAQRTGISVRTLHYYDEVGLLVPSTRSPRGHRLYTEADLVRLRQILSLRLMGLSLGEIRRCLDEDAPTMLDVIRHHQHHLRAQIEAFSALLQRLEAQVEAGDEACPERLLASVREMALHIESVNRSQAPGRRCPPGA